jgi:hypothetical protein
MMCESCPFRSPSEARSALLRHICEHPKLTWPCHKEGVAECEGRRLFVEKIAKLAGDVVPLTPERT